ncbi:hypothetical protein ACFQ9Q_40330 [Streptomyces virginiae]|uniref:hypothetical protein n=1 Tax=Streptomyces virginiae TaxID=1961 RepID=UPI003691675A
MARHRIAGRPLGFVLVLLVSLHLSWETSRLEAETRTLAEDVAPIRAHLVQQGGYPGTSPRAEESGAIEAQVKS